MTGNLCAHDDWKFCLFSKHISGLPWAEAIPL